jgi:hypothetical protein
MERLDELWETAAADAGMLLGENGYRMGEEIGCGHFACAYEIHGDPGRVVKLTGDFTEAAAWVQIAKAVKRSGWAPFPALPRVDCAFALPTKWPGPGGGVKSMYAIVQEKLEPLTTDEQYLLYEDNNLWCEALGCLAGRESACWNIRTEMAGFGIRFSDPDQFARDVESALIHRAAQLSQRLSATVLRAVADTLRNMDAIGVVVGDLHQGNFLWNPRSRRMQLIDLGVSEIGAVSVPRMR